MKLKDTLLMPKTKFEMRGNLGIKEPLFVKNWQEEDLYALMRAKNKNKQSYVLHDGPPYANGNIHCGHMLNRILKDFVVRFKNMQGFDTPFRFGWDTHGLPIENQITKSGINRKEMSVPDFRKLCEDYARLQVATQKEQIRRLGIVGDYDNPYMTLTSDYEGSQLEVFKAMALKGLIYRGLKPVHWSPSSESALAEAEIEYADVKSHAIYVRFPVVDGKGVLTSEDNFVIWTTTPWTLPANLAISLHPRFNYGLYETSAGRLIILEDLLEAFKKETGVEVSTKIATYKGQDLEYITTSHPLFDRTSLVILGEHVTSEAGTGAVHTAPGHGVDDFIVGQKYHLDVLCPVDAKGVFTEEAGKYQGMFYEKANAVILEDLKANNRLLKHSEFMHSYPHDWRTNKPLIFRATPQWFASIEPIRATVLEQINLVKWTPEWGKLRISNMVKDRGDWCISRQRVWGVPIPIIYNEDGSPIIETEVFDHVIKLVKEHGSNIWFSSDVKDLLPPGYTNSASPNGHYQKETDIMDVWFDSGSSSFAVLKDKGEKYPADLYLEGNDQYRGWFNSSLIISVAVNGISPYLNVVSHGFVMDDSWAKMSKSKGNGIDPLKIANEYGADILRLWSATINYQDDVRISEGIIKQISEIYRKVRNTFKFMLGNLQNGTEAFDLEASLKVKEYSLVDTFILAKLEDVKNRVIESFNRFDFANGMTQMLNFISNDLSSFYLDITKDVMYCEPVTSVRRNQVQSVIAKTSLTLMKLLTPILSFTMQEVYENVPLKKHLANVQLESFPEMSNEYDESILKMYAKFNNLRDEVLGALEIKRGEGLIGSSQEAEVTFAPLDKTLKLALKSLDNDELARLFVVSRATISDETSRVVVNAATGEKCVRCWNYRELEQTPAGHICHRCHQAVGDFHEE
ncbi:MAG TPA: isoleucine--tRNA ligase [Bacilli bacterium]|nr:isoleucine--tRNA ligase [Bacilli bacterium]